VNSPADPRSDGFRRRTARGFSLLEAMCAFAILGILTGSITIIFNDAMTKGGRALSKRELREAADTIFRKIIFEWHESKYQDGASRTLDQEYQALYGGKDGPKGFAIDRWAVYRYHLEVKDRTVAGVPDLQRGQQGLFESQNPTPTGTSSPTATDPSRAPAATEAATAGPQLRHIVMRIYLDERKGADDEPLLVLSTWIDTRQEDAVPGTAPTAGRGR
jgi:type II secretory pathway pseudopilin PulG